MNLTEQQKELLRKAVGVYTSGCHEPFIFVQASSERAQLLYVDREPILADATENDLVRLRDEGLLDCTQNPGGGLSGKPSAKGIILVHRNFSNEIPVFPNIKWDSIERSQSFQLLNEDLSEESAINLLLAQMFQTSEAQFYLYKRDGMPVNAPLNEAIKRGDILNTRSESFYFAHPSLPRTFVRIENAATGQYTWDWQRAVVEKGPEYNRITLKLSERKRREMETWEKICLEAEYRQQFMQEQNRSHVFLSYAAADYIEAEEIQKAIEEAGGKVFLDKKSLDPGENFAERIRAALHSCRELWLLVSPNSLTSEWVITEWGAAWVLKKTIVPILHRCKPQELPARLSQLQCIDMYRYRELVAKRFPKA